MPGSVRRRRFSHQDSLYSRHPEMQTIGHLFELGDDQLHDIMKALSNAMDKGLKAETHPVSSVKMFPTFVNHLPDGTETGKFLALDLGGTNFRVLMIELFKGNIHPEVISKIYCIAPELMTGTGKKLFEYIADCIINFCEEFEIQDAYLPLGFTFSFPCKQLNLTSAILTNWTKGFKCAGVEGEDVVILLKQALADRQCKNVGVVALINDTVGCLMSCASENPECFIGLILGTGTNACYMEDVEKIELAKNDPIVKEQKAKSMVINMEWGAFGDHGELDFIRTEFDREIDRFSLNPKKQLFEKMISGMYMGELVRIIAVHLIENGSLLKNLKERTGPMFERQEFLTKYVSKCEDEPEGEFVKTEEVLQSMGITDFTQEDCRILRRICSMVSRRAAFLAAAGIATLLNRLNKPFPVTVAVDGTLYKKHPRFAHLMKQEISHLINPNLHFDLMLSVDGSGIGAAIVAAVAHRSAPAK